MTAGSAQRIISHHPASIYSADCATLSLSVHESIDNLSSDIFANLFLIAFYDLDVT